MPALSSCPIPAALDRLALVADDRIADLREFVVRVPDPRARRGVRHSLASILLLAATAVAAGARSFTAIGEWAADAPQRVLKRLGTRFDHRQKRHVAPDESTMRGLYTISAHDPKTQRLINRLWTRIKTGR